MKLTRPQRAALFAGELPKITYPGKHACPVQVGHVEVLSKNVSLEVTEIRRTAPTLDNPKGDHSIVYHLRNNRIGSRFLAAQQGQSHPEQYATSPAGSIDLEAGEAVDAFTQKRLTREARERERIQVIELVRAAESTLQAIKDRAETQPTLKRTYWPLRRELDRFIQREKRKAA